MVQTVIPRYEFRIFGNDLSRYENKIKAIAKEELTRKMDSIYLLTAWKRKNNVKIREGVMDIKNLEKEYKGLQQWNPFLVGEFPLPAKVIKTVVFPALGIESPVFARKLYTLNQFLTEVVSVDPDLAVSYVWKTRHAYTINDCITEIAEIKVNGASLKTICIEAEDPEKVIEAKKMLGMSNQLENVSYPLAMKRIMGLAPLPDNWNNIEF
jgi:cell division protein FtsL